MIFAKIKNIGFRFILAIYNYFYKINGSQLLSTLLTTAIIITLISILMMVAFVIALNIIGFTFLFIGAWLFVMVMIAAILFVAAIVGGY